MFCICTVISLLNVTLIPQKPRRHWTYSRLTLPSSMLEYANYSWGFVSVSSSNYLSTVPCVAWIAHNFSCSLGMSTSRMEGRCF